MEEGRYLRRKVPTENLKLKASSIHIRTMRPSLITPLSNRMVN